MARSVQPSFLSKGSASYAGVSTPSAARPLAAVPDASRSLAGMLLAAVVAALMVVADQLIETWADGHLLVVWVGLWTVAFAALALLAPPLRQLSASMAGAWARWSALSAARRDESQLWNLAQQDYRVMRDIQMAQLHSEYANA